MQYNKERITASCSKELKHLIEMRAQQLSMSVSTYLKFAAIKDIEEFEKVTHPKKIKRAVNINIGGLNSFRARYPPLFF